MTYCPPERSPRCQPTAEFPKGRARKRKDSPSKERRSAARTTERIQVTAHDRQEAWRETGQPNRTYQLTRELDGLYGEHRHDQAGTLSDPVMKGDPSWWVG